MSEYLERETAVNIADHAILEHPYDKDSQRPEEYSDYNQGWSDACDYIRVSLTHVPAADVAPVVHGKWVHSRYDRSSEQFDVVKCSRCGLEAYAMAYHVRDGNYCPRCGARMDGGNGNG